MALTDRDADMTDMVEWLAGVEEKAFELYSKATLVFAADKSFAEFLRLLAEEEEEHHKFLSGVAAPIARQAMAEACFSIDATTRNGV